MTYQIDLEHQETQSLMGAVEWKGKEVLEIGCGDGRLARRVAGLHASMTAIDPQFNLVKSAVQESVQPLQTPIRYCASDAQQLPFAHEAFDIVLFGWSL